MVSNQQKLPRASVIPTMRYRNATAAVEWLCTHFGFQEHTVYRDEKGNVQHAELSFGNGAIMIGPDVETPFARYMTEPEAIGNVETQVSYLIVNDPHAHCERARAGGATILMEPSTKDYGGTDYACRDPFGHIWSVGTYDPFASK